MSYINEINNYSEHYKEFGDKIIENSKAILIRSGIEVFPQSADKSSNLDTCVIINAKNSTDNEPVRKKEDSEEHNDAQWIRNALPTSDNIMSISSKIKKYSVQVLANKALMKQNNSQDNEYSEGFNIANDENNVRNVNTISNASDDEGEGNLLQTLFEKDINEGFSSNSFIGTNYERNFTLNSSNQNISAYSDNLYHKNKTSTVFGGSANIAYNSANIDDNDEKFDYNIYAFGKYESPRITYGAGAIGTKNDGVSNININIGAMHNSTGLYAIIAKDITKVPGLPTQTNTNINIGFGKVSGMLNPDDYNKKDQSIEEISDIDQNAQTVENKESGTFELDPDNDKDIYNHTIVNLIISDSNNRKEYGIKAGRVFKFTSKEQNYSFVMPYGKISNTSVDSNEGLNLILGANAGQKANVGQWEFKTKGIVEASRNIMTGSRPSDYVLVNVNVKANKNNFNGELSTGGFYTNSNTYCKYFEAKFKYNMSKQLTLDIKGGIADSKFDNEGSKLYQFALGANYSF